MKYVRQFCHILAITFVAELLRLAIPAPIPASVYGMTILFVALKFRLIKLEEIETVGGMLLALMPLSLVPAAVGLVDSWSEIRRLLAPGLILIVFGTLFTLVCASYAARATRAVAEKRKK